VSGFQLMSSAVYIVGLVLDSVDIYDILEGEKDEEEEGEDTDRPVVEDINDIDDDDDAAEKSSIPPPPPPSATTETATQVPAVEGAREVKDKEQEAEEFAKEIRRAECIVETYRDVKVFPLLGTPSDILKKSKYANKFDGMFVSSRAAQFCSSSLSDDILKPNGLVVMETGILCLLLRTCCKMSFIQHDCDLSCVFVCLWFFYRKIRHSSTAEREGSLQPEAEGVCGREGLAAPPECTCSSALQGCPGRAS
jgi:hypothetical protein